MLGTNVLPRAAAPVLDRLCQKVSRPIRHDGAGSRSHGHRRSSQTRTPFLINAGGIGSPVNWLLSGVGRAYLAYCPNEESEQILRRLRK